MLLKKNFLLFLSFFLVIVFYFWLASPINQLSFWYDEMTLFWAFAKGVKPMFSTLTYFLASAPLDYILRSPWHSLLGLFDPHDVAQNGEFLFRVPSMFFHYLSSVLLFLCFKKRTSSDFLCFLLAALYFVHPFFFAYSIELRFYALASLLGGLQLFFFLNLLERPGKDHYQLWFFLFFTVLGFFTHFYHPTLAYFLMLILILCRPSKQLGLAWIFMTGLLGLLYWGLAQTVYLGNKLNRELLFDHFFEFYKRSAEISFQFYTVSILWPACVLILLVKIRRSPANSRLSLSGHLMISVLFLFIPFFGVLSQAKEYFIHPRHLATFFPIVFYFLWSTFIIILNGSPLLRKASYFFLAILIIVSISSIHQELWQRKLTSKVTYDFKPAYQEVSKFPLPIKRLYLDPNWHKKMEEGGEHQLARWSWVYYLPLFQKQTDIFLGKNLEESWKDLLNHLPASLLLIGQSADDFLVKRAIPKNVSCQERPLSNLRLIFCYQKS